MALRLVIDSLPSLAQGAMISLGLALSSMSIGLVLGLITALFRLYGGRPLRMLAGAYISLIRGTPLLVQLYTIYYGLPQVGITIGPWPSAIIALSVNVGAYLAETMRASIMTVDKGQWEAGLSSGLGRVQTFMSIIGPQAVVTAIPPVSNSFIGLIKDTSLVSVIAVVELLRASQLIIARTYQPIALYLAASAIYWILSESFSRLQGRMEANAGRYRRS